MKATVQDVIRIIREELMKHRREVAIDGDVVEMMEKGEA